MRTTVTLDDDLAAKLKEEARRSGRPMKETINALLRLGLVARKRTRSRVPFTVQARDVGQLRGSLTLDKVGELLEQVEGPAHR